MTSRAVLLLLTLVAMLSPSPGQSPDVIVGDIPNASSYGSQAGIYAYSIGTTSCNVGTQPLAWIAGTNQHPVIAQNVYRLKDDKFEQVGMSWLKHGYAALQGNLCGGCTPYPNSTALGVGCSDPYGSGTNGSQGNLGPRSEVNAATGYFPYPYTLTPPVNTIGGRIQIKATDLDPNLNAGAQYFVEAHYIHPEDATFGTDDNNASWRACTFSGSGYNLVLTGATQREEQALRAWQSVDPSVLIQHADVPGDGRVSVAFKAAALGGGLMRYVYAVQNLSSDRSVGSFTVSLPAGATTSNLYFHDVRHHSGEPFSNSQWTGAVGTGGVTWMTPQVFVSNPNENALRWGSTFTFAFDCDMPPGGVTLGLFKPGTPTSVSLPPFVVPTMFPQIGDPNRDYTINGVGSGSSSWVTSSVASSGLMTSTYATTDAGAPIIWATAPTAQMSWFLTGTNSADIGPGGLVFLVDGSNPAHPLSQFFVTSPTGNFQFAVTAPASLVNSQRYFAMAHLAPTSPDGFWMSQTHLVSFTADPNLTPGNATCSGGSLVSLGDDAFVQQNLGYSFSWYGVSYTSLFIGSNGYVTFGAGHTVYNETVSGLVGGLPRIAMWWDDLNPATGGTVTWSTDNVSQSEVCFSAVPEYSAVGANSFRLTLSSAGSVAIDFGAMGAVDGLVGCSPGNNLGSGLPLNLSSGPNPINAGQAPYQLFDTLVPNDLAGYRVVFTLDVNGNPISQN
ncbi:MAG: hypothetical protein CMJ83_07355 [Planctomycetes bacterium]|nr:hypothetical protein [Planctomycetota bacterium]